jgi:hypothetical protein
MVSGYSFRVTQAMGVFVFPLATLAVIAGGFSDEPSEAQMKLAFETSLSVQVRNALDFVADAGGPEALRKVKEAGTDRFAIRSFRKLDCARTGGNASYLCRFAVDVEMINGNLDRQLNGRFSPGSGGLAFAEGA